VGTSPERIPVGVCNAMMEKSIDDLMSRKAAINCNSLYYEFFPFRKEARHADETVLSSQGQTKPLVLVSPKPALQMYAHAVYGV